jgi:chromosomal replication initiator protein
MIKDHTTVWENCLEVIRDNISFQAYKTWFGPIQAIRLQENVLTIQVPSQFFYEWIEENYIHLLRKTIKKELGKDGKLEYSVVMSNKDKFAVNLPTTNRGATKNQSANMPIDLNMEKSKAFPNPFIIPGLKKIKVNSQLNENYSFENFVEGDCNRLARSAGYAVAQNPGKTSFNPLFLYSNTGLGKTHLSQAIGLEVKNNFPDKTVLYVRAEQFLNQFIDAVQNNSSNDFVHFYQMIDVLIIDDIHVFASKEKTQDIFFNIFNHLHQNGKQLVITSDKPPVDLVGIKPRLLSRFKWGLAADLQTPDLETRIAILHQKLYKDGLEMPEDVIEYLAYSISSNVRELEGAMVSILAQSSLNKKAITLDLARNMIDKFVKNTSREISIDYIQKIVSDYFNIPVDVINSKTRKREIVQARQIAMFFSKKYTKSSLATIGIHCGNKDHATVLHACRTVNNLLDTDKQFRAFVTDLEKKIKI